MLNADNLSRIEQIASWLPVVYRAGFEYELGSINGGLDFQQGIFLHDQEVYRLLEASESLSADTPRQLVFLHTVSAVIREIANSVSPIHPYIRQLWLEFDCRHSSMASDQPSIFLALVYEPTEFAVASEAVCRAYVLLTGQCLDSDTQANLNLIFKCAVTTKGISHAGFMIGREDGGLRLVLPVTDVDGLETLLTGTAWKGDKIQNLEFYRWLATLFPEIRLCIDIKGCSVQPTGFECFFKSNDRGNPRKAEIPEILAELTSKNLCGAHEAKFMEDWPGWICPTDRPRDWPDDLLVRSLSVPENCFLLLERQLSHIKFSELESAKPTAKIYFGFVERTIESRKPVKGST